MYLDMDLVGDLRRLNIKELQALGDSHFIPIDGIHAYARLAERRMRDVPQARYRVNISRELSADPLFKQFKPVLREIRFKLERSHSIAMYLPFYERPGRNSRDAMLNHWGIRHLHLSLASTVGTNGFVKRSDYLLFFLVSNEDIYWLHIGRHDAPATEKWLKVDLLEVMQSNWPGIQHLVRGGHINPPNPQSIRMGRNHNVNVFTSYRGSLLAPVTMGVMTDGTPMILTTQYQKLTEDLRAIEYNLRAKPYEFGIAPHLAYAHVTLESWDQDQLLCKEQRTGKYIPFYGQADGHKRGASR